LPAIWAGSAGGILAAAATAVRHTCNTTDGDKSPIASGGSDGHREEGKASFRRPGAILGLAIAPVRHKISRYAGCISELKEALPGLRTAGQNHISGQRILADKNFGAFEPKFYG
jgi:hypothetical protein